MTRALRAVSRDGIITPDRITPPAAAGQCVVPVFPGRRPCPEPSATPLGLCVAHLREAAAELARIVPRPAVADDDPRPCSTPFRDLCARCGRAGHGARECDAL